MPHVRLSAGSLVLIFVAGFGLLVILSLVVTFVIPALEHQVLGLAGRHATAKVTKLSLYEKYSKSLLPVDVFEAADVIELQVSYDGHDSLIWLSQYNTHPQDNYRALYDQAVRTHHIPVRYLSWYPRYVRPEAEFSDPAHNRYAAF